MHTFSAIDAQLAVFHREGNVLIMRCGVPDFRENVKVIDDGIAVKVHVEHLAIE